MEVSICPACISWRRGVIPIGGEATKGRPVEGEEVFERPSWKEQPAHGYCPAMWLMNER